MPKSSSLGSFELMVMLTLLRLGDDAYGVTISREIEAKSGSPVAIGSVYAALERLEKKGYVSSELGEPTPERGGRKKRYFRVTGDGMRNVARTRNLLEDLWRDLPDMTGLKA